VRGTAVLHPKRDLGDTAEFPYFTGGVTRGEGVQDDTVSDSLGQLTHGLFSGYHGEVRVARSRWLTPFSNSQPSGINPKLFGVVSVGDVVVDNAVLNEGNGALLDPFTIEFSRTWTAR